MSLAGLELGNHLGQALVAKADTLVPGTGPSVSMENIDAVLAEEDTNVTPGTDEIAPSQAVTGTGLELTDHLGQPLVAKADADSAPFEGPTVAEENIDAVLAEEDTNVTPGSDEIAPFQVPPSQAVTAAAPPTMSTTRKPAQKPELMPIPSAPTLWTIHDWLFIVVGVALWLGVVFAAIWMPTGSFHSWRHVALACCFAPLGAILRWYMSRWNVTTLKRFRFPAGTFAANILGTIVLAAVICLQHSTAIRGHSGAAAACQVFSGLQDGFCGRCSDSVLVALVLV